MSENATYSLRIIFAEQEAILFKGVLPKPQYFNDSDGVHNIAYSLRDYREAHPVKHVISKQPKQDNGNK